MGRLIDLTGKHFGRWTVIERVIDETKANKQARWLCECSCENHTRKIIAGQSLRNGSSQSCGCLQKEITAKRSFKDLTGQKFGLLSVIECTGKQAGYNYIWKCKCECGNICEVRGGDLSNGHTSSCGCLTSSLGEKNIQKILTQNNIEFCTQYTFKDLRYKDSNELVRFDFFLPQYNRLIEFDGIQRFQSNGGWNSQANFEQTQKRDKIRNQYAIEHNISLVRIPYIERDNITLEMLLGDQFLIG